MTLDSHTVNALDAATKPVPILSDSVPPPRLTSVLSLLAGGVIRRSGSTRPRVTRFRRAAAPLVVLVPSSLSRTPPACHYDSSPFALALFAVLLCAPFAHAAKLALASSRYPTVKGSWDATHNHQLVVVTASVAPSPAGSSHKIRDDLEVVRVRDVRHAHQVRVHRLAASLSVGALRRSVSISTG